YVWSQKPEKPEKAEEAKPVENPPPREEPPRRPVVRHTPSSSPKPPRKETTSKPPAKKTTPTTTASKTKSKPPAQVYFTAEEIYPNGIPDRIVIHNMPEVGQTYTLHLVGVKDLNRGPFRRAMSSSMGRKEWEWDVRVDNGSITVMHD